MKFLGAILETLVVLLTTAGLAAAQQAQPTDSGPRQSLDDAWWTGPMLAPSAATLPRGHFLIEPYLYDVIAYGTYDHDGKRRSVPHSNGLGSLTYINYGLADKWTVGLIPTAGYNVVSNGVNSAGVGLGDITVQAQYRLLQFHEGSWIPTTSFNLQETFPTGKYDRLGSRPSDGLGSGAYTTTIGLYSQTYFWMPTGRILRMRFNVQQAFSSDAKVQDVSVYGTADGFRGHAAPGSSTLIDASWEYSVTRSWVLASDVVYRHAANTRVTGFNAADPTRVELNLGSTDTFAVAPAIEYSWKRSVGVLLGVRLIPAGRNTTASVTPAVAINIVH